MRTFNVCITGSRCGWHEGAGECLQTQGDELCPDEREGKGPRRRGHTHSGHAVAAGDSTVEAKVPNPRCTANSRSASATITPTTKTAARQMVEQQCSDDDDTSVPWATRWRAACEPVLLTGGCGGQACSTDGGDRESFRRAGFGRRRCGFRGRRRRRSAVMWPSTRGPAASSACTR